MPLTRDHLSAISAITLDGRLFLQVRKDNYDGEAVVGFLRVLLRKIAGKILLIWDGSPIHHGQAVKDFLSAGAAKRLQLERLPGYAPDLNPDEGIWNYLEAGRTGQRLRHESGGPASPPATRCRPRAPQARHHPRLLTTVRILALVPSDEISRNNSIQVVISEACRTAAWRLTPYSTCSYLDRFLTPHSLI